MNTSATRRQRNSSAGFRNNINLGNVPFLQFRVPGISKPGPTAGGALATPQELAVAQGLHQRNEEVLETQDKALVAAQSLAAQQEQLVTTTRTMLTMLAESAELKSLDANGCSRLFAEVHRRFRHILAALRPFPPGASVADRK